MTPSYTITLEPGDEPMIANLDVIYVLAGLGGGILILTILVITVCTIFFCLQLAKRKRQMLTLTVDLDPPHNVYTLEEDEQPHGIGNHATSIQRVVPSSYVFLLNNRW